MLYVNQNLVSQYRALSLFMSTLQDMFDKAHFWEATVTPATQPLAVAHHPALARSSGLMPTPERSETLLS